MKEGPGGPRKDIKGFARISHNNPVVPIRKKDPERFLKGNTTPEEAPKEELYVLSGIVLQDIWNRVDAWRGKHPLGLGQIQDGKLLALSEEEARQKTAAVLYPSSFFEELEPFTEVVFSAQAQRASHQYNHHLLTKAPQDWLLEERAYARLRQIVALGTTPSEAKHVDVFLTTGFSTGYRAITAIAGHLPSIFLKDQKKPLPPELLLPILEESMPTVKLLAAQHIRVFKELFREGLSVSIRSGQHSRQRYHPDNFCLQKTATGWRVEIRPEALARVPMLPAQPEARHTCIALSTKDQQGQSIVDAQLSWLKEPIKRLYLPHLPAFNETLVAEARYGTLFDD